MKKKRTSFGALDVFVILLVFLCAAGIAVRFVLTDEKGILAMTPQSSSAAVQILISGIEQTSQDQFAEDISVGIGEGTGRILSRTVRPAEYYEEDEDGELYIAYEDENNGKIDVRCTVVVEGWYSDNGVFMLEGESALIPGATVSVSAGDARVLGLIIDVTSLENDENGEKSPK